jgi:hypothetical protein
LEPAGFIQFHCRNLTIAGLKDQAPEALCSCMVLDPLENFSCQP